MIDRFVILNHGAPRPDAERVVFCDGAGGSIFRDETDLDLSHWRPNRTPRAYRAGTSTEICFRFLDAPLSGGWTLAVNNHLDVDGILSVYVLVHAIHARSHRQTIVQAAEMGDFWGWGESPAQRLFQGLTRLMNDRLSAGVPAHTIYDEAFRRIPGLIDESDAESSAIDDSLAPLRDGVDWVKQGAIRRIPRGERFTQYVIPNEIVGPEQERAQHVPGFNAAVSPVGLLWPQVRARWDKERACLVSAEMPEGWHHDLWFPGYLWADTEGLWTVPGLRHLDGMERYELRHPGLTRAVAALQQAESGPGQWTLGGNPADPQDARMQALFPLILRTFDGEGKAAPSRLDLDTVAAELGAALA